MSHKILIVDDEVQFRLALKRFFEREGYRVLCSGTVKEALECNSQLNIDVAIVDLNLPDGQGTDLIEHIKSHSPEAEVILITGEATLDIPVVTALQKGAFHFISKPFEPPVLLNLVRQALNKTKLKTENKNLKSNLKKQFHFNEIIGQSSSILKLTETMKKIARNSSNVLITGESGTGKELVARSIHCAYKASSPFVSINCGAISKELLESEFFGHMKGSFTGAHINRKGRFQQAEGGTLFLDEIGALELSLQVKLLRVLQEKEFSPVGSNQTISCTARIISATNEDLEKSIKEGTFREDLYYRLHIIPLHITPLRKRAEDIPLLINHFIKSFNEKNKIHIKGVTSQALSCLCHYGWPGNIRELENLIERLSVLKEDNKISMEDLPDKYKKIKAEHKRKELEVIEIPNEGIDFNGIVGKYENEILLKALEKTNWNRRRAASLLKLNRTTLVEKIKKKGLKPKEENEKKEITKEH